MKLMESRQIRRKADSSVVTSSMEAEHKGRGINMVCWQNGKARIDWTCVSLGLSIAPRPIEVDGHEPSVGPQYFFFYILSPTSGGYDTEYTGTGRTPFPLYLFPQSLINQRQLPIKHCFALSITASFKATKTPTHHPSPTVFKRIKSVGESPISSGLNFQTRIWRRYKVSKKF